MLCLIWLFAHDYFSGSNACELAVLAKATSSLNNSITIFYHHRGRSWTIACLYTYFRIILLYVRAKQSPREY